MNFFLSEKIKIQFCHFFFFSASSLFFYNMFTNPINEVTKLRGPSSEMDSIVQCIHINHRVLQIAEDMPQNLQLPKNNWMDVSIFK